MGWDDKFGGRTEPLELGKPQSATTRP